MSVYDVNGNEIFAVYDVEGTELSQAYDIDGNPLLSFEPVDLTVMTYNVQHFTYINSQAEMLAKIFGDNDPDIIGIQEISTSRSVPTVGANALVNYPYIELSNHINYNGLASKIALSNVVSTDYQTQDQYDIDTCNETRCYMKCYFTVGNRQICWLNTHLSFHTASARYAQIAELFNIAQQERYVIITGDMNGVPFSTEDDDYIYMFKQFVDAGYNLANCSPTAGFTKTWTSARYPASLADLTNPYDNIITSGNITIRSVTFDTTKFDYETGNAFDHVPVVAEVTIT